MEIENTTALVTGANRGIGCELVRELLRGGARRVYAAARNPETLSALRETDARIIPITLDVTQPAQIAEAAKTAADVDLLINNAGTLESYGVLDATGEQLRRDLDVNFFGVLDVTKAFAPALEQNGGAVVNMLTLVALASMAGIGGYAASKAAAWSLTQSLRVELGKRGVRVFGVYPGAVDTDMIRSFEMDKTPAAEVARNVLGAIESDTLDSFPDPMSKQAGAAWLENPRALEAMFANM